MLNIHFARTATVIVVAAVLLAGCAAQHQPTKGSSSTSPVYGGEFSTFLSSDPATLDPILVTGYDQTLVAGNVLEGLYRVSADGTKVVPGLAEIASLSDDGLTWTIKLRKAKFQNGTGVTAKDVKFSFERLVNPASASPRAQLIDVIEGAAQFRKGTATAIDGIKVVNPGQLSIKLTQKYAPFLALLASPNLAVVPQAAVEADPKNFGQHVISAGPFTISNWKTNQSITATAFKDYWDGRPYLDDVVWRVIPDENTRMLEFESNNLSMTWLTTAAYSRYANDASWKSDIRRANTIHTEMLAVNMEKSALAGSLELRQAICEGVDRKAAIASLQGRATEAATLMPKSLEGKDPGQACTYNPNAAKAVFAKSGLASKSIEIISPNWPNLVKTLELYQANLKALGLNVELAPLEYAQYQARLDSGDFDLAWTYRVPDFIDADSFISPLLSSDRVGFGNAARYSNSTVDSLLKTARESMKPDERAATYGKISKLALADLPYIPLVHNVWVDITQHNVEGYVPSALDMHKFAKVWLSK